MTRELDRALERLDDYVRGHDREEDASSYEEALFARALAGDAPELGFRRALEHTLQQMKARGTLSMWLTAAEVEELAAGGLRVRRVELDLANPQPPDLSGEFDILVTRVPLDLSQIRQLEAEVLAPDGQLLKRMPDISFDPADGAVYACCEAELARIAAAAKTVTRVWVRDESGRRLLSEIRSA